MNKFLIVMLVFCVISVLKSDEAEKSDPPAESLNVKYDNETSYDPRSEYRKYLQECFGTEDKRPPADVLEQRCIEDLRRCMILFPQLLYPNYSNEYYLEVTDIYAKTATLKYFDHLNTIINGCAFFLSRCGRDDYNDGLIFASYFHIYESLSHAWLKLARQKYPKDELKKILLENIKKNRRSKILLDDKYFKQLASYGKEIREDFYRILLTNELEDKYPTDFILNICVVFDHDGLTPTKEETDKLLVSDNPYIVENIEDFVIYKYPHTEIADKLLIKKLFSDYQSHNLCLNILGALDTIREYCNDNTLNIEKKNYFLDKLDERMRQIECDYEKKILMDPEDPLSALGKISMFLTTFVDANSLENDYIRSKYSMFRYHLDWYEKEMKKQFQNSSDFDDVFKKERIRTIARIAKKLDEWEKETKQNKKKETNEH